MKNKSENSSIPVNIEDDLAPKLDKFGRAYATGRRKQSVTISSSEPYRLSGIAS